MPLKYSIAALPCLTVALVACQTVDMERVREINPFKPTQAEKPAPVRTGEPTTVQYEESKRLASPEILTPAYQVPRGGENTISFSMAGCWDGCPVVNVMIDPDNYWQRVAPEGSKTGQGRDNLYNDISSAFQAQGFYAFQGELNIIRGNDDLCSDYQPEAQVFYVSLSRNGASRVVNFDSGCAGSASADGAADAINALVGINDFMDVVSGSAK